MPDITPTTPANPPEPEVAQPQGPQMYTSDQYHGLRGALQHQIDQNKAQAESLAKQLAEVTGQHKSVLEKLTETEKKAQLADELSQKLSATESTAKAQASLNARLQTLMKFPGLLSEETIELVKSTSLEGEALEKVLAPLAARLGTAPNLPLGAGATPTLPQKTEITPQGLMSEAMDLASKGDWKGYQAKLMEAAGAQDAVHGRNTPPVDKKQTPPVTPPVG